MSRIFNLIVIFIICLGLTPLDGTSQKKQRTFVDTLDNALDFSYYLNDLHGFLPLISPITEPAVGYGAAGAGLFFIPKNKTNNKKFNMPDVAGVAGGLTENGTWFAGIGYAGFWKNDRIRYRGVFGYGDIKLKYYGIGDGILEKNPANFSLNMYILLQQALFRINGSNFFLGSKYILMKTQTVFFDDSDIPVVNTKEVDLLNSGIGIIAEFENFNNIFSPSKGLRINLTYDQYLKFLGSDSDFGRITFFSHYYQPIIKDVWISGFRVESQISTGNSPFYMMPFISLRGVPAMRYQGELIALIETEQELVLTKRWSIVGFTGLGAAVKSVDNLDNSISAWNIGTGFRYIIARLFGLKMGLDIAKGPEQWAVYVVLGTAWMK